MNDTKETTEEPLPSGGTAFIPKRAPEKPVEAAEELVTERQELFRTDSDEVFKGRLAGPVGGVGPAALFYHLPIEDIHRRLEDIKARAKASMVDLPSEDMDCPEKVISWCDAKLLPAAGGSSVLKKDQKDIIIYLRNEALAKLAMKASAEGLLLNDGLVSTLATIFTNEEYSDTATRIREWGREQLSRTSARGVSAGV